MTLLPRPTIADIAAALLRERQDFARAQLASGAISRGQAVERLLPWAAIAAAAGAEFPERRITVQPVHPPGPPVEEWLQPWDFCPRARWVAALERARDEALLRHDQAPADPAREQAARRLMTLACALGAGPIRTTGRKAA